MTFYITIYKPDSLKKQVGFICIINLGMRILQIIKTENQTFKLIQ